MGHESELSNKRSGMRDASMEDSASTFERMMEHHTDILPELMSVTSPELFLEKYQQLPGPDSEEGSPHFRVRIKGITSAYNGFMAFVRKVLRLKSTTWTAMIWGSAIFILKVIIRNSTSEYVF
jgi:hypothetical protein